MMRFKSDAQRKAVFSRLNEFALKYDRHTGNVTSTDYPNVSVTLWTDTPRRFLKELENIPEQHLAGLGAIVSDENIEGIKPFKEHQMAVHTAGVPIYGPGDRGSKISFIRIRPEKEIKKYFEGQKSKNRPIDVLAHEIGHNMTAGAIGVRKMGRLDDVAETIADRYMQEYTGAEPRSKPIDEEDAMNLEQIHYYQEALQELKNPSVRELSKYAEVEE